MEKQVSIKIIYWMKNFLIFAMFKNADLGDKIDFHYEQLIDSIRKNNRLEDDGKIERVEEYLEKFSEISAQLKETFKKHALDLIPYSEEESKDYFEIGNSSALHLLARDTRTRSVRRPPYEDSK